MEGVGRQLERHQRPWPKVDVSWERPRGQDSLVFSREHATTHGQQSDEWGARTRGKALRGAGRSKLKQPQGPAGRPPSPGGKRMRTQPSARLPDHTGTRGEQREEKTGTRKHLHSEEEKPTEGLPHQRPQELKGVATATTPPANWKTQRNQRATHDATSNTNHQEQGWRCSGTL